MVKMVIFGGAIIASLIIGGVLEVKVHPEELSKTPGRVLALVTRPETVARARATFTDFKRRAEQAVTKDEQKRLQLSLGYVKSDAERLQQLSAEKYANGQIILPQAELLDKSVQRLKEQMGKAPIETLLAVKNNSRDSLARAEEALKKLQEQRDKYEALKDRLTSVTKSLEASFKELFASSGRPIKEGEVAGLQDMKPSPSATPTKTIPLNF